MCLFTPVRHHRAGAILISSTKHLSDVNDSFEAQENSLGKFVVPLTASSGQRGTYYFFAVVAQANGAPVKFW